MTFRRLGLILLTFSFITSCSDRNFMDKTRIDGSIISGTPTTEGDAISRKTVAILDNFSWDQRNQKPQFIGLCTGLILSNRLILTAAHCADKALQHKRVLHKANIKGSAHRPSDFFEIENALIPSTYKGANTPESDIALIKLKKSLPPSEIDSIPSSFFTQQLTPDMTVAKFNHSSPLIAGYGNISTLKATLDTIDQQNPFVLNQAYVVTKNFSYSVQSKIELFLVDQKNKSGACNGDSGGPLFIHRQGELFPQGLAVAVTFSRAENNDGIHNACSDTGVYLNLDLKKDWIYKAAKKLMQVKSK